LGYFCFCFVLFCFFDLLFSLLNEVINDIRNLCGGVEICQKLISILLFADDIILLAKDKTELQSMLDILSIFTSKWRLKVNRKKTKIVVFDPKRKIPSKECLYYNRDLIEVVDKCKYLGVFFNSSLNWNDDIEYLIASGKKKSSKLLHSILRYKCLSVEAKLNIWNTIVRPSIE